MATDLPNDPHLEGFNEDPLASRGVAVNFDPPEEVDVVEATPDVPDFSGLDPTTAQAISDLVDENKAIRRELKTLQKRADEDDAGEGGFPFMYYKRPDRLDADGRRSPMANWIVCASGGIGPKTGGRDTGSYSTLLSKGFKALTRYGVTATPGAHHRQGPGSEFVVLLQNGGGKEVPASQVLQLRWHLKSPLPGTVFPQYEQAKVDGKVQHFLCDEGGCTTDFWFLDDDQETAGACLDHLRRRHEYKYNDARTVLKSQGITYRTSRVQSAVDAKKAVMEDEDAE